MDNNLILLISFAFSLVVYGLIAKWYIAPRLKAMPREAALTPFLLFHAFRYVGLIFLVPGVVSPTLPGAFANPAAYGDLAAAILALIALGLLRAGSVLALPLVWVFNIEGAQGRSLEETLARMPIWKRYAPPADSPLGPFLAGLHRLNLQNTYLELNGR